jgi:hypothetical protein
VDGGAWGDDVATAISIRTVLIARRPGPD